MNKEELEKEAEDYAREWLFHVKDLELHHKEDDKPEYIRIKEAYLAGAEPREKRIAELEKDFLKACKVREQVCKEAEQACERKDKRIAELEHQLTHRNCLDCSNHSSNLRMRNLDLEKENAELKELIERLLITPRTIYRKDEDGELSSFFNPAYEELKKQAENFLKESEVEK